MEAFIILLAAPNLALGIIIGAVVGRRFWGKRGGVVLGAAFVLVPCLICLTLWLIAIIVFRDFGPGGP
jgi:hypothetical protein